MLLRKKLTAVPSATACSIFFELVPLKLRGNHYSAEIECAEIDCAEIDCTDINCAEITSARKSTGPDDSARVSLGGSTRVVDGAPGHKFSMVRVEEEFPSNFLSRLPARGRGAGWLPDTLAGRSLALF